MWEGERRYGVCADRIIITYVLHLTSNIMGTQLDSSQSYFGCPSTIQIPVIFVFGTNHVENCC